MDMEPADSFEIAADGADLRVVEVAIFDLGDLALADTDALSELCLRQASLFAQLTESVCPDLSEQALLVCLDEYPGPLAARPEGP
jgi:uncharacterized protein YbjT (DUF2867 family)